MRSCEVVAAAASVAGGVAQWPWIAEGYERPSGPKRVYQFRT